MAQKLGFDQPEWNNSIANTKFKKKNWWKLIIPSISADGVNSLPPSKSSKPSLSFKEITVEHLNETISYPGKPEWKPITLTLYDLDKEMENPVFAWIRRQYDVKPENCAFWKPCLDNPTFVVPEVSLIMFNGCGEIVETWVYEHVWPQQVDFGDLDMSNGTDVCTVDLTLKYHRAYISLPSVIPELNIPSVIPNFVCGISQISWTPPSFVSVTSFMMAESVKVAEFKIDRW